MTPGHSFDGRQMTKNAEIAIQPPVENESIEEFMSAEFDWFAWVLLPLLIFSARVVDVTLGTIRIIFTSRGQKYLAPLLGFVEVFIWITVIAQITKGAQNIAAYLAYAGGFAVGNYVGMYVEDKLALGMLVVRAIVPEHIQELTERLHEGGYGVTSVNAHGSLGPVKLVYTIVKRKDLSEVADIIQGAYPSAFFTVEELRSAERGVFPASYSSFSRNAFFGRKSK
jgi:uncharacterized protein YebE (UPF0316 family)